MSSTRDEADGGDGRAGSLVPAGVGLLCLAAGLLALLVAPTGWGPLHWAIGLPLLLLGLANLALLPRFAAERRPADKEFEDLGPDGRALVGTPEVRRLADCLHRLARDLPRTPLEIQTSPTAVRVSGPTRLSGLGEKAEWWRITLAPTSRPDVFVRVNQAWGRTDGREQLGGSIWTDRDGDATAEPAATRLPDPALAVIAAVREAGIRLARPTIHLVGLVNAIGALVLLLSILAVLFLQ